MKCDLVNMDSVEIDPELFMTCRLCLKEKGLYQITPAVSNEIRFSFNIETKPYDGFSQIICKTCKSIMTHFSRTKTKFLENNETLKKMKAKIPPQPVNGVTRLEDMSTDDQTQEMERTKTRNVKRVKKKKVVSKLTVSSDSSDEQDTLGKVNPSTEHSKDWLVGFQEYYVCRYCDRHLKSLDSLSSHLKLHRSLVVRCHNLITRHCTVRMNRIDCLPNITGNVEETKIVALNSETLILDDNIVDYYLTYLPKAYNRTVRQSLEEKVKSNSENINSIREKRKSVTSLCSVLSSDEELKSKEQKRKRLRLKSTSSSEKEDSIINGEINKQADDDETKPVDNTSTNKKPKVDNSNIVVIDISNGDSVETTVPDDILDLVRSSYNKVNNKLNVSNSYITNEEMLNRKVISIGRKVMSKQGMTSTGLLKYLEKKNLAIEWTPQDAKLTSWKEMDYVRIMTKVRNKKETETFDSVSSSVKVELNKNYTPNESESMAMGIQIEDVKSIAQDETLKNITHPQVEQIKTFNQPQIENVKTVTDPPVQKCKPSTQVIQVKLDTNVKTDNVHRIMKVRSVNTEQPEQFVVTIPNITNKPSRPPYRKKSVVQHFVERDGMGFKTQNQLLNANPVANPKQAPKKKTYGEVCFGSRTEVSLKKVEPNLEPLTQQPNTDTPLVSDLICLNDSDDDFTDLTIGVSPIVTSVVSLASALGNLNSKSGHPTDTAESEQNSNFNTESKRPTKTTDDALASTIKEAPRIKCKPVAELMSPEALNSLEPNKLLLPPTVLNSEANHTKLNCLDGEAGNIVLDTVNMPNTTTSSPFMYFQTILKSHNITLLNSGAKVTGSKFHTLVKFKLDIQQSVKSILLCLTLLGHNSEFCIKVQTRNKDYMDVNNMTPSWQWEVLKAFQDDAVIVKIKEYSDKNKVSNCTELFLNLLKSIKKVA